MIISAARSDRGIAANLARKKMLRMDLDVLARQGQIRFAPALCFYKGESEHSFVVVVQDASAIKTILDLGVYYDQECVLIRDDYGVYLHYMQYFPQVYRAPERIGRDLYKVEFDGDNRPDSYTYLNGQAWVAA
jgi:hypothetical protein